MTLSETGPAGDVGACGNWTGVLGDGALWRGGRLRCNLGDDLQSNVMSQACQE